MVDVSKARADRPYVADEAVPIDRASALHLIHQLLALKNITAKHRKEQLKIGLWKWTEAEGIGTNRKYNTRYFSAGVMRQAGPASINHEHVWTMAEHVKTLTARSWTLDELEDYLTRFGVACIVTVEEHAVLSGCTSAQGWDRYRKAGVQVFDRATGTPLDLEHPGGGNPARLDDAPLPLAPELEVDLPVLIQDKAGECADYLIRLLRMARFAFAVGVPAKTGAEADYFLVYDTLIEEPTRIVAFPHWTGRVAFGLVGDDLEPTLRENPRVTLLADKTYGVSVKVIDDATLWLAEELLFRALEKLRSQQ